MDFLIPRISLRGETLELVTPLEPLRYTDFLFFLRRWVSCPWKHQPNLHFAPSNYTVHGLKATLLSWAPQLSGISDEWRRLQGHHKSAQASVRLYSRDDVWGQLALQRSLIQQIRNGARPKTPIHRGGQHPATEPSVTIESFKKEPPRIIWKFNDHIIVPDEPALDSNEPAIPVEDSSSSSSSDSSSGSSPDTVPAKRKSRQVNPVPQDSSKIVFGAYRNVIATWMSNPADKPEWLRSTCGRSLPCVSVSLLEAADGSWGQLCNHGGCKRLWQLSPACG